tara:strand:- start:16068 stop:16757 length:690 start_codon:yes stop_codon:yes gene_type:complete
MNEIKQINVYEFDERFYQRGEDYNPSVTYKLSTAGPSEWGLQQWRGDVGNKRADEIMEESGALGSYVHDCLERMVKGDKVSSDEVRGMFKSKQSLKVLKCLSGFLEWIEEVKPEIIDAEYITWNDKHNFAGTIDLKCKIDGEIWLVDYKTSKSIHNSHKVQLAAYGYSEKVGNLALLHLGNTTKKGWSFLPLKKAKENWAEFEAISNVFEVKYPNAKPNQHVFPEYFKI